jgi:dCTP diphosphatase
MSELCDTMPVEMQDLLQDLKRFNQARDWDKFHSPSNLAKAISIESAELLETFLWNNDVNHHFKHEFEDEVADIFIYLMLFCEKMGIDPIVAANAKIAINEKKYPVDKCKGRATKYDAL